MALKKLHIGKMAKEKNGTSKNDIRKNGTGMNEYWQR